MFLNQIDGIRFHRVTLALVSLVPAGPRVDIKKQASRTDTHCFLGAGLHGVYFIVCLFLAPGVEIDTPKPVGSRDPHRERQTDGGALFYHSWNSASVWLGCVGSFLYIELFPLVLVGNL